MGTSTAGSLARVYHHQMVHYLRRGVTFADNGTQLIVGTLPANAIILKPLSGIAVTQAFNAGTTNVVDIGTSTTGDLYATDLAAGTLGAFVPIDEVVSNYVVNETTIFCTVQLSGTAATTGSAEIVICYIPDNDR